MSSVRLIDRTNTDDADHDGDEWVAVLSPRLPAGDDAVALVTDAIARVRQDYMLGVRDEIEYGDMPEYGGGDAELAGAVEESIANRWDD